MIYSLANALLILFSFYAAIATIIVVVGLLRELPDFLADAHNKLITSGARIVRPSASQAQVDGWCEAALSISLALLGVGALYLFGQGALLVFG